MNGTLRSHVLWSPAVQALGAAATLAALIGATREGHLGDIAAFAAGTAIAGLVSVAVSGGTPLVYAAGSAESRMAVRYARLRVIAPATLGVGVVVALGYNQLVEQLAPVPLLLGVVGVALTNLASLEAVELQRHRRMLDWAVVTIISKCLSLILVLSGLTYSAAMTLGYVVLVIGLGIAGGPGDRSHASSNLRLTTAVRQSFRPKLALLSLFDVAMVRAPFLVAPYIANESSAGAFAALLSTTQAGTALATSALYTVMAQRSNDDSLRRYRRFEILTLSICIPIAALGVTATSTVLSALQLHSIPASATMWVLMILSAPLVVFNRASQYRMLNLHQHDAALALVALISSAVLMMCTIGALTSSLASLASSLLIAESIGLGFVVLAHRRIWSLNVRKDHVR